MLSTIIIVLNEEVTDMFDMHVHSIFSHDGKSTPAEYAAAMESTGMQAVGFTEHVDFMPDCDGYEGFDFAGYFGCISECKAQGLPFYTGAEIDYAPQVESQITQTLEQWPFDYTIGSVHVLPLMSISTRRNIHRFTDAAVFLQVLEQYYHQVRCSLAYPHVDGLAHIGIFKRFLEPDFLQHTPARSSMLELEYELAKACAYSDKLVEVNTSGLFSEYGATLPDEGFLHWYIELGGSRVCLGSDAHRSEDMGRGFVRACDMLERLGIGYIYAPWNREHPVSLETFRAIQPYSRPQGGI